MSRRNLILLYVLGFLIFGTVPPALAQVTDAPAANTESGVGPTAFDVEDVRQVQLMLKNRGYDPGEINGMVTGKTQEALRQFQAANNLPVTGNIDYETQKALGVSVKGPQQYQSRTEQTPQSSTSTSRQTDTSKNDKEAGERVEKAATVLQELTRAEDKRIPNELLERAEAIAVIPHMIKGAFGIGGRYGKGVVSRRMPNGNWSPPAFIQIGGGSFGLQLGGSATDLVLVFTDDKALDLLTKGKDLKLGADAAVAAGPIGREAEAGVNANLESAIYAYSRSKGLFAGVALDGAVIDVDDSMNKKVYGSDVKASDILAGKVAMTTVGEPFVRTVEQVVPKKRISER
jgi:lipid-binding SYLF domain-containing protein